MTAQWSELIERLREPLSQMDCEEDEMIERAVNDRIEAASALVAAQEEIGWKENSNVILRDRVEAAEARVRLLEEALRDGVELVEMDDEFNTPGTDAYTWLAITRQVLLAAPSHPVDQGDAQ